MLLPEEKNKANLLWALFKALIAFGVSTWASSENSTEKGFILVLNEWMLSVCPL